MRSIRVLSVSIATMAIVGTVTHTQNSSQLSENGWHSDDTRADGLGANSAGTNLISPALTDDPEATASGTTAHNADIRRQITFGPAPGSVPAGTHTGAVHMTIAPGVGSGKSQISHRLDNGTGHSTGASAFGPAMSAVYSWMGDGTRSVTAGLKIGVKTSDFGSTGTSSRTGENVWDKVLIYEPGNLNGGTSDSTWRTETIDYTTGRWWFFDRTAGASIIGSPMTLSDMSTSPLLVGGGPNTVADVYALITAPGAHVTSIQFGIGSGNAGGSVYVNQLETNFYRSGSTTSFGLGALKCDQNATPDVIFGSGNANSSFTQDCKSGVELGLRAKLRFNDMNLPENTFNSNGDGTYSYTTGSPTGGAGWVTPATPFWNFEWTVNTDFDGSTSLDLDDFTYEIGIDFDPGPGTNFLAFDPINVGLVPFWDHAIGDNTTPNGGGTSAGDAPTYLGLIAANNVAQNSWNVEFFNDAPFDIFDPNVAGAYEFYLSASMGATEVARTEMTVLVEHPLEFDQDVTSEAIFGSGNLNGAFTTRRGEGLEVGLRGKVRFPVPLNVFNSNGDGTYTFDTGTRGAFPTPLWAFEWSVNSDHDGTSGLVLDGLTYELGIDFDPGPGTNYLAFDPIAPGSVIPYTPPVPVPFWDHSIGTNATANGAGTEAGDAPTYLGLIASNNLAQNSWRMDFFDEFPFDVFDPTVPGRYDFYLAASDADGEVVRTEMTMLALSGASLTLEAAACQTDQDCNLPGTQILVDLWMRNLDAPGATGFQAFLAFDDSKLTYEGTASSYTATPFATHIQSTATAEVAAGELRLDGNAGFVTPTPTDVDSKLATLIFTVAAECDPVEIDFDVGQAFPSELSDSGTPLATSLLDSGSLLPDATPPLLSCPADIVVTADAGVGAGCDSAVVAFATPAASDTCSAVTVECVPPSGTAFPVGTTTVTCVATDACGNQSTCAFDVTVTPTNMVCLDVQLVGVTTATTRCIRFVMDDCGTFTDVTLAFDSSGLFSGEIEVPCGSWSSICAKDEQHTQWGSSTLSVVGTKYDADLTIDLFGGDTDNDGDVDINDVTLFLAQFGSAAAAGGCPWDGVTRDSDFSNNGFVGSEDYAFIVSRWLTTSDCACAVGGAHPRPIAWVGTSSLPTRLRTADLNQDGLVNHKDVRLFELAVGLPGHLSAKMRARSSGLSSR